MGAFDDLIPQGGRTKGGGMFADLIPQPSFVDRAGRYARGVLDEVTQGLTLGFGDEMAAAVDAAAQPLGLQLYDTSNAPTWSQRYAENLAAERGRMKQFKEQNPVAATAANVGGSVIGAVNLPKSLYSGATLGVNMLKGGVSGGVLGGAQGFGEGEGGLDNRLSGAQTGAMVGTVLGAGIPLAGGLIGYGYQKIAPPVLRRVADAADNIAPKAPPKSLSAAAPEGGQGVATDSWAATIADKSRAAATSIEDDAAVKRLALEIARSGGTGKIKGRLDELGEGAFIADASKGTGRLANVGAMLPGEAGEKYAATFGQRNKETGKRFLGAMGDEAKVPSVYDAQRFLDAYKRQTGDALYDPVLRSGQFNVSPEMDELLKVPAIRDTMNQILADADKHGVKLGAAEAAHMVKRMLNQNTDAAFASGKATNKDFVRQAGDAWEQALWNANPAIKEADTAYAKVASLPDWLERGGQFMKGGQGEAAVNVSPSALADALPGATPAQLQAFKVGSSNTMKDAATAGPEATRRLAKAISDNEIMQQKLTEIYGPEVADRLMRRSAAERTFAETQGRVLGGSQTAERTAAITDDFALSIPQGGTPTPASLLQAALDKYNKMREPSEAVRSRLADLLANPDPAANAETLRLIDALLKQQGGARPVGAGVAGAAGGNFSSPR